MPFLTLLFGALAAFLGLFDGQGAGGDGAAGSGDASGGTSAGGSGDQGGSGQGAAGAGGDAAGGGTDAGRTGDAGDGQAPAQRGTQLTDPTQLQRELDEARRQAAGERQKRTDAETQRAQALDAFKPIAKLLGFDTGEEPDAAKLQAALEETQGQLRAERVNNAFFRIAAQVGADPELTLRYLRGGNELNDLDPSKDDFEATLKTIVQAAVTSTPQLKAAAPQAGGGAFDGGSLGGGQPSEPEDLAGLVTQRVAQQRRAQA